MSNLVALSMWREHEARLRRMAYYAVPAGYKLSQKYLPYTLWLGHDEWIPGMEAAPLGLDVRVHPITKIQRVVADYFGVTQMDMLSHRREVEIALPRQIAQYICKTLTLKSLPEIGRRFDRDHTSVLHAVRKIGKLRTTDVALDLHIRSILFRLERKPNLGDIQHE